MLKIAKKALQIFFGADSVEEMKKRGLILSVAVPAFRWIDWVAVGLTASAVALMKTYGLSNLIIFLILWIANMAYSGSIIFINDRSKIDITLSEAIRRLVNATIEKSRIAGYLLETALVVRLVLWDGPDNFIIFFRERLSTFGARAIAFIAASGIQMAVWTLIYVAGYEGVSGILKKIF